MSRIVIPGSVAAIAVAMLTLAACTNDPLYPETPITVQVRNLPPLEGDLHYEIWFSYPASSNERKGTKLDHGDNEFFSVGKFRIAADGSPTGLGGGAASFSIPVGYNANLIADAIVTIERSGTPATAPGRRVIAGPVTGDDAMGKVTLVPQDGEAFGEKFIGDTTAWCALDAPTSDDPADSASGLWFVLFRPNSGGGLDTVAGLKLAPQPLNPDNPGWTYQSWLIRNEGTPSAEYIKLGRFRSASIADVDGAGSGAGANSTRIHSAPGSDFAGASRRMLNDGTYGVAVSMEPDSIDFTRPYITVMKLDRIVAGARARSLNLMTRPNLGMTMEISFGR